LVTFINPKVVTVDITYVIGEVKNAQVMRQQFLGWPKDAHFDADYFSNARHFYGITKSGQVISCGSCALHAFPNGNGAHFGDLKAMRFWGLAVVPEFRNQGVGSAMLREIELYAKEKIVKILWANSNMSALPFYEKHGFDVFPEPTRGTFTGIERRRVACRISSSSSMRLM
jgi:GNAT superfamily N-acetyltransferase